MISGRNKFRRRAGIALMLVLVFVVLLTAIVTSFVYEAQVDATAITFADNDFNALLAAKSSVAEALSILEADLLNNKSIHDDLKWENVVDSLEDYWAVPPEPSETQGAVGQVTIADEYGKINLNALIFEDGRDEQVFVHLEAALRVLFSERGMLEDPVDAILDWLDSDDEVRPHGYESSFYRGLDPPYEAKNGPMDSIEELLLIPGITADVFFGTDEEAPGPPLSELLTVHGHPQGMVNVNTTPEPVLVALLSVYRSPENPDTPHGREAASMIAEHLEEVGPFDSAESLREWNPPPPPPDSNNDPNNNKKKKQKKKRNEPLPPANFFDFKSSMFRIQSDAASGNAQVRVQAYVWRATDEFAADARGGEAEQMFRIVEWQVIR